MARRRRHMPLVTPKSLTLALGTPTQSLKSLAQPSKTPEESSKTPSQLELQPVKLQSPMPTHSASSQSRSAEQRTLEAWCRDASGATKNQMRTRASMRRLELLKMEDEKPQPQNVELQSSMSINPSPQSCPLKRKSLEQQSLNSSDSTRKRMRTRASMRRLELSTEEDQQSQTQPAEMWSSMPVHSAPHPESSESQPLDAYGSIESSKRTAALTQNPDFLARADEQLKSQFMEQQSSEYPIQSQSQFVGAESPITDHSFPQAGYPEGKLQESQPLESCGSTKKPKRTRGPTRCLGILTREDKQPLSIAANEFGQPIGPNARKLTSFLGTVIRDRKKAPLLWHDWRAIPQKFKDIMWENVQEKFLVGEALKDWVMMSLATKWRNFKASLKKKHYDGKVGKDRLVINDRRVDPAHWRELVSFWDSDKGQLRSSTNKANRAKLHVSHTAGSKSFAIIREELRIKSPDLQNPSQTVVYVLTHTRKDGLPVDETSAAVMAKLSEQASEQEASECNAPMDEILTQILGADRNGRVRTFGLGPSPTDVYGPKPTRNQALQMVNEIKKTAEEKLIKMTEQMKAMKAEQEGMRAEQEEMKHKYEDRLAELQTQLQAVMQLVQENSMNFQALEEFSLQQHFVSSTSSHLLQTPNATSSVGVGNAFPSILRRRKVSGDFPSQ